MFKKSLSILLAVIMVLSIFTVMPFTANAQKVELAEEGAKADLAESGATKTQAEAVQWIKDRGNERWWQDVDGVYGCQCVDLIQKYYQYFGYNRLSGNAGDYVSGHLPINSWYYSSTPIPGSVFVRGYDNVYTNGHVGLVYAVDGSTIYTVETNVPAPYNGEKGVSNANFYKRSVSFATTFINPDFVDPDPTPDFTPADIGTDFYASIENTKSIKPIIASGNNVVLGEMSGENNQIWKFERQSDISYKIINVATGSCLDDENYGTANESNIQVCVSNDSTAQRWYLKVVGNGYSLVPKCALNSCIDIQNGVLSAGSNVQLFQQNSTDAQIFTISPRPSFNAINKGDAFTAAIIFNATGSAVTAFDNNNVGVMSYTGTANQIWSFERKSNRSYKITNVATGKCLDDENYGTSDKTNIQVCPSNNTTAQRWFLKAVGDGFSLAPQCALNSCIDSFDGGTKDGMNIYLWTQNSTAAQIVSLKYVLTPDYETTYNGHVYKLFNKALPWREAYKFCEQQDGHLVTVNSENEQSFLYSLINENSTSSYLWLGATDSYEEGKWKWITGDSIVYRNWADNEPNNSNDEDYMVLYKNSGKWNDGNDIYYSDTKAFSFICEYDNDTVDFNLEKSLDYNGHRYEVYTNSVDWQTAKRFCEQKGGHLLTISNSDENNIIKNNVKGLTNERYWLGLTDIALQSKWNWITGEPIYYNNWNSGEPNNTAGIETYAEFVSANGSWNDLRGFACISLNIGFICEYDEIPAEPTSYILGDVDGDGEVTIIDATCIQRKLASIPTVKFVEEAADADEDGELTIIDATVIQRWLVQLPSNENIGKPIAL